MSKMLSKMNLISVVQQLPKEDIEIIQGYVEMIEEENKKLKDNWNKLREYIGAEWYSYDNDSVEFEVAKDILNKMQELQGSDK